MCGHVGVIGSKHGGISYKLALAFQQMLWVDTLRGPDATGICIINSEQGAEIYKESSEADILLQNPDVKSALTRSYQTGIALLGHNRKATVGGYKDANAHPFTYEDRYVFFHNGTLTNHKALGTEEVDSDTLGRLLTQTEGNAAKVNEVTDKVYGAWACVWYDADKNHIYFLRNHERPLHFIYTKTSGIVYCSELWMGLGILHRNDIAVEKFEECKKNTLYCLDLNKEIYSLESQEISEKKFPAPVSSQDTGATKNGGSKIKQISKKTALRFRESLVKEGWISFKVVDAISYHVEDPPWNETGDYLVIGKRDDMPGVDFRSVVKNIYPSEAKKLIGNDVHGNLEQAEFGAGILEVWCHEVFEKKGAKCH